MEDLKNKKILFITHTLDTTGAPKSLLEILKVFYVKKTFRQMDLFSMCNGRLALEFKKIVNNFFVNKCENDNLIVKIVYKLIGMIKLGIVLFKNDYDLIFINSSANFRALLMSKIFRKKVILYVRETDEMFNSLVWLRKNGIKLADKVIAVSSVNKYWLQKINIDENKIFVIGNGVNFKEIDKKIKEEPEKEFLIFKKNFKIIGIMGKIDQFRKGFDLFIDIMKGLDKSKYRFILIGDFKNEEIKNYYLKILEDNNLKKYIYITGFIDNVFRYIKYVDHMIIPSRQESFSRALLEPLSVGKIVSCFDIGGNKDVVGKNYPFIVAPFDIKKIITHILNEQTLKQEIDFEEIKKQLDINEIVNKIENVIKSI